MDFIPSRQNGSLAIGPYLCTNLNCGKSFLRKEHLNRHLVIHTNSRPHKCFICGRSFARSDILNRHVLQHNVPPDAAKRTPLACQACRRRKIKCDSQYPCATCKESGETCLKEPSSMQAQVPKTRSRRKRPFGGEKRPKEATEADEGEEEEEEEEEEEVEVEEEGEQGDGEKEEEVKADDDPDGCATENLSTTRDTSSMRLDWTAPVSRSSSNSASNTRQPSLSTEQDPLRSLTDPNIAMLRAVPMPHSSPSKSPPFFSGELSSLLSFPFGPPPRLSPEDLDQFSIEKPLNMRINESGSIAASHTSSSTPGRMSTTIFSTPASSTRWLQPHDTITSRVQSVAALVKSAEYDAFHQAWPFLHIPTFAPDKQNTLLISALTNLSIWMQDANRHHLIPYTINQELTQALMPDIVKMDDALVEKPAAAVSLRTLQALVITLIYAILGDAPSTTLTWAAQWTDTAISTFRRLGVLDDCWLLDDGRQLSEECWVLGEQMKRLVYTILRIDTYLSLILDRPPTLRYQEIGLPLPVSEALWRADTREARTRLHWNEPSGRAQSAFSTMIRDGLETQGFMTGYLQMPHLSLEDNHFSLCAFLSELWGISKEAHGEHHMNYRSPEMNRTKERVNLWKGYLYDWRVHIEKSDNLEDTFYSTHLGNCNRFLGLNLTLYHLLCLKVYGNVRMLELKKCCANCREPDIDNMITSWAQSPDGRHAVYHAVQLKRIYERETMLYDLNEHRLSNVLSPISLLASAIVLCYYSVKVSSGSGVETDLIITPSESIELAQSKLMGTPEFENWISQGGMATVDGVPIYTFSLPRFSSWYREQLMSSPIYSSRLVNFLLSLKI
ncbi:hypothetical protein F1880_009967 [Penicillium rolfsii]|nr:hypothetical protein F1880_009967 [Penicillium rolfsii]